MKDSYVRKALVRRVVDGDTIDVDVDLGYKITTHQRLRLARIDAPEMRGKNRAAGQRAKEFVRRILTPPEGNMYVYIQTFKSGKYGRYIAEVLLWTSNLAFQRLMTSKENGWVNLSDLLLEKGLAKPYGEGKNK